jgi:hypothetical protein
VPDCEQACDAIDRGPEIIAVALVGCTGVERHAHAHAVDGAEILANECSLRGKHCSDGIFGPREGHAEFIADRLEDEPAVMRRGRAH